MMNVIGSSQRFDAILENLIEMQKENYKEIISEDYWHILKNEVRKNGFNDLVEILIPIYKKHLTESEIDSIIEFYESEAGQKMVSKFPLISKESMQAGVEWGAKLNDKISEKINSENEFKFNIKLEACGSFKEGKFSYQLPDGTLVSIKRKGNKQIETTKVGEITSRIEWLSDCRYNIWELDENNEKVTTEPIQVNIYEIDGNSYKFIAKMQSDDFYSLGQLEMVE
ncbi:hypothetical protein CJ739_2733 [Mariniflexile rhizosphaerae]|nr:hypothetical protein CJ739_2733 [Mariniflexile sp. TRM1-10]PLB20819.1 MAG: hypothetical protein TRG1_387 [Flavobacteriaceae bacterium FS1-H7996/R]